MAYTALGRCASSGAVYAISPSFSVFNSNLQKYNSEVETHGRAIEQTGKPALQPKDKISKDKVKITF